LIIWEKLRGEFIKAMDHFSFTSQLQFDDLGNILLHLGYIQINMETSNHLNEIWEILSFENEV